MKNLISIFAGHDANITFYNADKDEYHLIELERLVKKRYFRLHVDNSPEYQKEILTLCQEIAEEDWGIENDYEAVLFHQMDSSKLILERYSTHRKLPQLQDIIRLMQQQHFIFHLLNKHSSYLMMVVEMTDTLMSMLLIKVR